VNVNVGDLIIARSGALVCGRGYELSDPTSWSAKGCNWLGKQFAFSFNTVYGENLTLCTVVAVVKFPNEAHNLSHFHVLLSDGRVARIFDDHDGGFWVKDRSELSDLNRDVRVISITRAMTRRAIKR
jgi:hypothetical protein